MICVLDGVGDQRTPALIGTLPGLTGPLAGTESAVSKAIGKRLAAAGDLRRARRQEHRT